MGPARPGWISFPFNLSLSPATSCHQRSRIDLLAPIRQLLSCIQWSCERKFGNALRFPNSSLGFNPACPSMAETRRGGSGQHGLVSWSLDPIVVILPSLRFVRRVKGWDSRGSRSADRADSLQRSSRPSWHPPPAGNEAGVRSRYDPPTSLASRVSC